ncbi:MAG: hypothetical protein RL013_2508, partial [Bacteroidota bacterium]
NAAFAQHVSPGHYSEDTFHRLNRHSEKGGLYRRIPESGNDSLIAVEIYYQGLILFLDNKIRKSVKRFREALESDLAQRNPLFREKCLNRLALACETQHNLTEAKDARLKSLCIAESRGDSAAVMSCLLGVYRAETGKSDNEQAVRYLLDYFHTSSNLPDEVRCLELLSAMALRRNDLTDFVGYTDNMVLACQKMNYPFGLAFTKLLKSEGLLRSGYFKEAEETIKETIPYCADNKLDMIYTGLRVLEAENYIRTGVRLDEAGQLLTEEFKFARASGFEDLVTYIKSLQLRLELPTGVSGEGDRLVLCHLLSCLDENMRSEITAELSLHRHGRQGGYGFAANSILYVFSLSFFLLILSALLSVIIFYYWKTKPVSTELLAQVANSREVSEGESDEDKRLGNLYAMIIDKMNDEKPYLDPDFSLPALSSMLNRSERYISLAIRSTGGTNFNRMVIGFRVEEACRLIRKYGTGMTMNEVGVRSGFANRMSFTRRFKEMTGMSPTEFLEAAHSKTPEQ